MKDYQKEALRKLRPKLVENVNMDGLLTEMEGLNMLNKRMSAKIKSEPTKFVQVEELLDFVSTRDDEAFDKFITALERNHDREVAKMLREASQGSTSEDKVDTDCIPWDQKKGATYEERDRPAGVTIAPPSSIKEKSSNAKVNKKCYEWHEDHEDLFIVFNQFTKHRQGTVTDGEKLKSFFKEELGFNYRPFENCNKGEFVGNLMIVAREIKRSKKPFNSLVVAIMSHGSKDGICTCLKDGKHGDGQYITIDEIWEFFNSSSLPQLIDCPKVFIVETCRGGIIQEGMQTTNELPPEYMNDLMRTTPNDADILIAFSTLDGFSSIQEYDGSAYIKNLVDVLRTSYKEEHMGDMIIDLQDKIAAKEFENIEGNTQKGNKQMPCMVSTFRKRMYLGCHKKK